MHHDPNMPHLHSPRRRAEPAVGPGHHVWHFCPDGSIAVVIDKQNLFSAVIVDAGNGAVHHGGLLHSGRTLFNSIGLNSVEDNSIELN